MGQAWTLAALHTAGSCACLQVSSAPTSAFVPFQKPSLSCTKSVITLALGSSELPCCSWWDDEHSLRPLTGAGMGKGERLGDEQSPQLPIFVDLTVPALEVSLVDHTPEELMVLTLTGLQVSHVDSWLSLLHMLSLQDARCRCMLRHSACRQCVVRLPLYGDGDGWPSHSTMSTVQPGVEDAGVCRSATRQGWVQIVPLSTCELSLAQPSWMTRHHPAGMPPLAELSRGGQPRPVSVIVQDILSSLTSCMPHLLPDALDASSSCTSLPASSVLRPPMSDCHTGLAGSRSWSARPRWQRSWPTAPGQGSPWSA